MNRRQKKKLRKKQTMQIIATIANSTVKKVFRKGW